MTTSRLSRPISAFTRNFNAHERRLVVQVAVIGLVVWAVTFALKTSVHWLFDTIMVGVERLPVLALILVPLTLGALGTTAVVLFRSRTIHYRDREGVIHPLNDVEGDGLERAIALYFASEPVMEQVLLGKAGVDVRWDLPTFSLAARKFLATLFTLGSGGSGGLEASVTLVGESLAAGVFKPRPQFHLPTEAGYLDRLRKWWRIDDPDDLQTAQLAGVAAAVATLLGTPFAAAFFAIEVMYRRRPIIEKLLFALIAALVAYFMTNLVTGHPLLFSITITTRPVFTVHYYGVLVLMGVIISAISILFTRLRALSEHWFHTGFANVWVRHLAGALLTGIAALIAVQLTGKDLALVLGTGDSAIEAATLGQLTAGVAVVALVAKLVATLATITSGGSAGLLIPSIYFGTMVAAVLAPISGIPAASLVVPAMTASLGALVNVPLAAVLFTVEAFGSQFMIPGLVVLLVSIMLVHDNNIYRTQRETYDARQVLPGYSVRRIPVPSEWAGKTLVDLRVRNRFDLNVIGIIESFTENGQVRYQVRFNPPLGKPVELGDTLIVLGEDSKLDRLMADLVAARARAGKTANVEEGATRKQ
ncbi:MAG: chloride channel protein [Caldilineales bacterium]